jgi:hypothetical protein
VNVFWIVDYGMYDHSSYNFDPNLTCYFERTNIEVGFLVKGKKEFYPKHSMIAPLEQFYLGLQKCYWQLVTVK